MKSKILASILGLALLALSSGCVGTPFRWDTARKIQVGMTKAQVQEIMGKPYVVSTHGESEIWLWSYGTGLGSGGAYKIILNDGKVIEVPKIPDQL